MPLEKYSWVQCSEEVSGKTKIMHCETLHDTCQTREMALLCLSIPLLHDGVVPFVTVERQKTTGFPSSISSFTLNLSCFMLPVFKSSSIRLLFLFFSQLLLSLSLSLSGLLSFTSFFSAQLLWDCAWSFDIKISSPHCCPMFHSSRPCNIKVRGDGPAVFNECLFAAAGGKKDREQETGKRCHPQPSQRDEFTLTKSPL